MNAAHGLSTVRPHNSKTNGLYGTSAGESEQNRRLRTVATQEEEEAMGETLEDYLRRRGTNMYSVCSIRANDGTLSTKSTTVPDGSKKQAGDDKACYYHYFDDESDDEKPPPLAEESSGEDAQGEESSDAGMTIDTDER